MGAGESGVGLVQDSGDRSFNVVAIARAGVPPRMSAAVASVQNTDVFPFSGLWNYMRDEGYSSSSQICIQCKWGK